MDVNIRSGTFCCVWGADQIEISSNLGMFPFDFYFFQRYWIVETRIREYDLNRKAICQSAPRIRILHEKLYRFPRFSASNTVSNPFS